MPRLGPDDNPWNYMSKAEKAAHKAAAPVAKANCAYCKKDIEAPDFDSLKKMFVPHLETHFRIPSGTTWAWIDSCFGYKRPCYKSEAPQLLKPIQTPTNLVDPFIEQIHDLRVKVATLSNHRDYPSTLDPYLKAIHEDFCALAREFEERAGIQRDAHGRLVAPRVEEVD